MAARNFLNVRKLARATAALVAISALALAAGFAWLGSSHGLDWLARQAVQRSEGRLAFGNVTGSLFDEVRVGHLWLKTDTFTIDGRNVALRWQPLALFHGELKVNKITAGRLHYTTGAPASAAAPKSLALPVKVVIAEVAIGQLQLDDQLAQNLNLRFEGGHDTQRLDLKTLQIAGWDIAGELGVGAAPPFSARGRLRARGQALGKPLHLAATLGGSLEALQIDATATALNASATASALLHLFGETPLQMLTLNAKGIDLAAWDKTLPRTLLTLDASAQLAAPGKWQGKAHALNTAPGRFDDKRLPLTAAETNFTGGANLWTFSGLDLQLPGTGRATGSGTIRGGMADFALTLRNVDPSRLHGRLKAVPVSGSLALSGDTSIQRIEALLNGAGLQLKMAARHADNIATVEHAELRAHGGSLDFSGRIALTGARAFSATGKFNQLDPSRFLDAPAAKLNGTIAAEGVLAPDWQAQVSLAIANSTLHGLPLTAHADFSSSARQPFSGQARAVAGGNSFNVSGRFGSPEDRLQWTLDAANLQALDATLSGRVKGEGTLAGSLDVPAIKFKLSAQHLALREYRAAGLELHGDVNGGAAGPLQITLKATGVRSPNAQIDELRLEGSGTRAHHTVLTTLHGHDVQATLRLAGGLDAAWRWSGVLDQLDVSGVWPLHLTSPANLVFGPGVFTLEQMNGTALGGEFGPAMIQIDNGHITTRGAFHGFSAAPLFSEMHNPAFEFRDLRFGGRWDIALAEALSGSAEVRLEQGDLAVMGDEPVALKLRQLQFGITAADNVLDAALDAESETMGHATARLRTRVEHRAGQWLLSQEAPLSGNAAVKMQSLAWARALLPALDRVAGQLDAKIQFDGTIGQPHLSGTIAGDKIALRALGPGLNFGDGRLRATLDNNILKINDFYLKAGSGSIKASGTAEVNGGLRSLNFTASADHAQIFASPQLTLVISGSGHAGLNASTLALDGRFKVDEGRYDLGSERRPELGDDVVIKGSGASQVRPASPLRLQLDVGVDLNDKFSVRGYGLDALLGGAVNITTRGNSLSALGTIRTVRGDYFAFGQQLDIEHGELNFSGPLGNPGLDLRATRKMNTVEVGVEVSGSLQRPVVKLVSVPAMPDSDTLAWLILGRDPQTVSQSELAVLQAVALTSERGSMPLQKKIAQELGLDEIGLGRGSGDALGAVTLGKRISDKLTVRIEQGLGGTTAGLVKIDYLLSKRWRLQGTTGAENAGDILFTLRFD